MSLVKRTYVDYETVITAENLNEIQDTIGDGQLSGFTATDLTGAANELKTALNSEISTRETYVRPNLLDNWYFVGSEFPINQRKQTGGSTSSGYYIDRWKSNGGAAVNIASGYFYLASGVIIFQPDIHIGSVSSDTVFTFSYINHATGSLISKTDKFSNYVAVGNVSVSFNRSTKILYIRADSNISIDAVKFEIGDSQTLAVLAGSTWTLLDIPDYQKELAKCQRYLFPVGGIAWFRSAVYDPNEIQVSIPCPPQFLADATAASILNSSVLKVSEYNTSWVEVTGFTYSCKGRKQNMPFITISAAKTSHGMTDPVISIASTDSFILISKET